MATHRVSKNSDPYSLTFAFLTPIMDFLDEIKENEDFQHMLHIRKCNNCNLVYMSDGTLRMYKNTSDKIDPSINFIEKDT